MQKLRKEESSDLASFISKNILTFVIMTSAVEIRTIKVSDKGQVSIPKDIRKNMKIKKGDNLVMMVKDSKIVLEKSEMISLLLDGEFKDIEAFTEHSLRSVWDNPYDEVWTKDAPANTARKRK